MSSVDRYDYEFPTSDEPEWVLSVLITDLRHLVNSADAYFQLSLAEELSQEERDKAQEMVPAQLGRMKSILDQAREYLRQKYPRDEG